jgi:hypothetical protein
LLFFRKKDNEVFRFPAILLIITPLPYSPRLILPFKIVARVIQKARTVLFVPIVGSQVIPWRNVISSMVFYPDSNSIRARMHLLQQIKFLLKQSLKYLNFRLHMSNANSS